MKDRQKQQSQKVPRAQRAPQEYTTWWVVTAWLLTDVFFGLSYWYAWLDSWLPTVVWFIISMVWLYIALNSSYHLLKRNQQQQP